MSAFGYSHLQEDTTVHDENRQTDQPPTDPHASCPPNDNVVLTDESAVKTSAEEPNQGQSKVHAGGIFKSLVTTKQDDGRQSSAQSVSPSRDKVKYTALKPTRVQAIPECHESGHLDEQEREDQIFDSYVRMRLTTEAKKTRWRLHVIICGLLCACVALVVFALLYVFVILPAHAGSVVYPDGKSHAVEIASFKALGKGVTLTTCGLVRGVEEHGAFVFKGIPYAVPPTGHNRWKIPSPTTYETGTCWRNVLNASEFGSVCVQPMFEQPNDQIVGSEDCLFLNVWTPTLNPPVLLPVMVWIHSGDLVYGSGHVNGMSPTAELAISTKAVYVSFNYRLGAFGFLALDELRSSSRGPTGNYGFMDQQLALNWVKENIRHFGGNQDQVTIFGHGSGATSIQALLASPGSSGLFQKAWMTSPVAVINKTLNDACEDNRSFLKKTGCSTAHCLRRLSPSIVSKASPWSLEARWTLNDLFDIPAKGQLRNDLPIFDGHVIHKSSVREGPEGPVVPVVIGTTCFEMSSLDVEQQMFNLTWPEYADLLVHYVRPLGTPALLEAKHLYSTLPQQQHSHFYQYPPQASSQFARLISDIRTICPARYLAHDIAYVYDKSAPVYMYVAEVFPSHRLELPTDLQSTFIGWDMVAFFDSFQNFHFDMYQRDTNFQNIVREEVMSFVKSGKPDALRWATVDKNTGIIGKGVTVSPAPSSYFARCDLWKRLGFLDYTWSVEDR